MKLTTTPRPAKKKSQALQLRREGKIPAIIYARGKEGTPVAVDGNAFKRHLQQIKRGHLSTTRFQLEMEGGSKEAIIKEIQYHPTTYDVLHLDFEILEDDVPVNVKVPIVCSGVADCVGIKLGGTLRQVLRHLRVNCLPKDIPESFKVDITKMVMNDSKRLSDLKIPERVRPLARMEEVIITIVKR